MSVINLDNLTRSYGPRRGIEDVSIHVGEGTLYGFLGPNGAGKTTAIRVLLGFLRPTNGAASVFGLDCWRDSALIKRDVGYVPGDLRLWPWMNGHTALKIIGSVRGIDIRPGGRELAERFELDLNVKVRAMSRGMRQKLGLVLALAHKPKLLVLDEPTSALDPLMQDRFRDLLRSLAARGSTVFFSSHTLGEVEALCERVAIVRAGRIVADSTLADLRRQARHEFEIRWTSTTPQPPPAYLTMTHTSPERWTGSLDERSLTDFLALLARAGQSVADVRLARPDLETIFRRYYQNDAPGQQANANADASASHSGARAT